MPMPSPHFAHWLMQVALASFLSVLFLQSGLDKVFDWTGNLKYQTSYFAKSPLKGAVPLLLGTLAVLEVAAGALSAVGVLQLLVQSHPAFAFWGAALSTMTFVGLFLGQRLAKDYAGAAGLVPYFLTGLVALYFTGH